MPPTASVTPRRALPRCRSRRTCCIAATPKRTCPAPIGPSPGPSVRPVVASVRGQPGGREDRVGPKTGAPRSERFRLEARLREKFRWKPSDLQNTRRPAFLGTALDRGEKTHGKSPGRSVFAKGNQYEERNGPDPGRPAGRSFPRLRRRAGCSDGLAHQGDKGSVSVGDKHFRTQAFKVRLVNAAKSEISLKNSCLVAQSAAGQSFRLDTVDEELTADTLAGRLRRRRRDSPPKTTRCTAHRWSG